MEKTERIIKSFRHAFRGFRDAFVGGQNFRIMVYLVIASAAVSLAKGGSATYTMPLIFAGAVMLVVELINTAMEKAMDLVLPASLEEIRLIKDMMAAAALVASVCFAVIVLVVLIA